MHTNSSSNIVPVTKLNQRINFIFFWAIHLLAFASVWTGVSLRWSVIGCVMYWVRMFTITGFYHRYFAHRSFKTSRVFQSVMGWIGTINIQKGVLWWSAKHRQHHRYSDTVRDAHSPMPLTPGWSGRVAGFAHSHWGWLGRDDNGSTDLSYVPDLAKYPELHLIDRYHWVAPTLLAVVFFWWGSWEGLIVGYVFPQVALWEWVFTINSFSHLFGSQRYATGDTSRNNWLLAIFTMGEGWHNNHHYFQSSVRQGFYWWEYDFTYYLLRLLALTGLIWDLKEPSPRVYDPSNHISPSVR